MWFVIPLRNLCCLVLFCAVVVWVCALPPLYHSVSETMKTSSVCQPESAGQLILRSSVRFRQKLKKPRTRICMDLRYIDPQAKVLNYCYK